MKNIIHLFLLFTLLLISTLHAKDVSVKGYYRSNGTYVSPHIRSSPDSSKWNNYGPSKSSSQLMDPKSRDNDKDGIPNYLDKDDNNNNIHDDHDSKQY